MARKPTPASKGVRFSDTVETIQPKVTDIVRTSSSSEDTLPAALRPGPSRNLPASGAVKANPPQHPSKPSNYLPTSDARKHNQPGKPGILVINRPLPPSKPSDNPAAPIPRKPVPAQVNKKPDPPLRRVPHQLPPRPALAPPKPQKDDPPNIVSTRQRQRSLGMIPDEQHRLASKPAEAESASSPKELTERELELLVKPEDSSSQSGWYQATSAALSNAVTRAMMDNVRDKPQPYDSAGGIQSFWLISTRFGDPRPEQINKRIKRWLNEVEDDSV